MAVDFIVEYAKSGRAKCKATKETIGKGEVRIGKVTPNPFADDGDSMTNWYTVEGFVVANSRARKHKLESVEDLKGFDELSEADQEMVRDSLESSGGGKKAEKKGSKRKASSSVTSKAKKSKFSGSKASSGGKSLAGKTVCVTGKITGMTRNEAKAKVIKAGGTPKASVTKNLDILVCGAESGSKLALGKAYGIEIWNEDDFRSAIGEGDDHDMEEDEDRDDDEGEIAEDSKSETLAHLTYTAGTSDKFWKIELEGSSTKANYGKNGTSGVTTLKAHATPAAARKYAKKMIAEKRKKGYVDKESEDDAKEDEPGDMEEEGDEDDDDDDDDDDELEDIDLKGIAQAYMEKDGKFWEIRIDGKTTYVRAGKVDTAGVTVVKDHTGEAKAKGWVSKQIANKKKKGFVDA